jgi:acetyl-CoA carboxylase biotin carboxyl carrier protein
MKGKDETGRQRTMPKVDIDTDFIEKLAELLARTGLTEIEICQSDTRIRVAKQPPAAVEYVQHAAAAAAAAPAPAATLAAAVPPAALEATGHADAAHPGTVVSPMVGTVYLSPEPTAPPFVKVGDAVKEGQTLLIIEAMKVMNSIRAARAGRVTRIFAANAAPVEYGEPLLVIE